MSEKNEALAVRATSLLRELAPVYDLPLGVSIEIGRIRLRVRDLMRLAADTVVELRKPAGEPFDICVNGVPVARGEVIVVEQSAGVRIIEIRKSAEADLDV